MKAKTDTQLFDAYKELEISFKLIATIYCNESDKNKLVISLVILYRYSFY